MKSGLIVQTSVGMRNVLAKKTLRSDAQPLSNRVATRMCAFDRPRQRRGAHDARAPGAGSIWDRRVRDRTVRHDRAPSSRARRSGLRLPVTGVRPTPLSQRRGPGPLPGPWNRLCPVGSRTRSRGRPERVRPSTDGGRRQPGFPGQLSDARAERRPPRPDGCSPLPSRDLPAPACGRPPLANAAAAVPLRHRADQLVELSADVARDGLHSRTQCGSWGVRRKLTAGDLAAAPWAATEG
jgi:hypothetical protein